MRLAAATLIALLASPALAAPWEGAREACRSPEPARSVPACTRIIADREAPGRAKLTAYVSRGAAYIAQGRARAAIADFTAAATLRTRTSRRSRGRRPR
jgi:hypothetical protein